MLMAEKDALLVHSNSPGASAAWVITAWLLARASSL